MLGLELGLPGTSVETELGEPGLTVGPKVARLDLGETGTAVGLELGEVFGLLVVVVRVLGLR